jgi:hypothetical protein
MPVHALGSLSRRSFLRYAAITGGLATLARLPPSPASAATTTGAGGLHVLDADEAEILTAIVERMVHSGDPSMPAVRDTRAIATIDAALLELDEAVVSQLRWLLTLFQYGPPLFDLRLSTFTGMPPEDRDEYIRGWAESRFQTRRLAFRALKNLAMLGYYTQDATWRGIHYDGPWAPRPRRSGGPKLITDN